MNSPLQGGRLPSTMRLLDGRAMVADAKTFSMSWWFRSVLELEPPMGAES